MNSRKFLKLSAFSIAIALTAAPVFSQQTGGQVGQDLLKTLKPGRWIDIAGIPQPDQSIYAGKINILTGDLESDDWEAKGKVISIDAEKNEYTIVGGVTIRVNDETEYASQPGAKPAEFKNFSMMEKGLLMQAEGTFLKDGTFDAEELKNKYIDPEEDDSKELALIGKLQEIDLDKKTIKVMNVTFKILSTTRVKNKFK